MRRVERVLLMLRYDRGRGGSQSERRGDGDVSACGAQDILVALRRWWWPENISIGSEQADLAKGEKQVADATRPNAHAALLRVALAEAEPWPAKRRAPRRPLRDRAHKGDVTWN
jgi:hypothetical protein